MWDHLRLLPRPRILTAIQARQTASADAAALPYAQGEAARSALVLLYMTVSCINLSLKPRSIASTSSRVGFGWEEANYSAVT